MANTTFVLVYPSGAASGTAPARYYIGDTFSGLPSGNEGDLAYAKDTKLYYVYYNSAWRPSSSVISSVSLTNQAADISSANLATTTGLYIIGYSLQDTTSDITAGAVTLNITYTDDVGAATISSAAQLLTGTGRTTGVVFAEVTSGNLAYNTSHTGIFGTAKYSLYISCEKLK